MQALITLFGITAAVFVAELGDKTQIFVVELASKERPRTVLLGLSLAVFVLNVMAVYLGVMISEIIREEFVKLVSGFAFLMFAYLALPEDNEEKVSGVAKRISVLSVALMFFMAELGDKTQLSVIALAAREPAMRICVFCGACIGMLLADGIGVFVGAKVGGKISKKTIAHISFLIFAIFGLISVSEAIDAFLPSRALLPSILLGVLYFTIIFISRYKLKKPTKI